VREINTRIRGPARVFDSEEEASADIAKNKIKAGDVSSFVYEGPKGRPGLREMLARSARSLGAGRRISLTLTDGVSAAPRTA